MDDQYKALCALARAMGKDEAVNDTRAGHLDRTHDTRRAVTREHMNSYLASCTSHEVMVATDAWMDGYETHMRAGAIA